MVISDHGCLPCWHRRGCRRCHHRGGRPHPSRSEDRRAPLAQRRGGQQPRPPGAHLRLRTRWSRSSRRRRRLGKTPRHTPGPGSWPWGCRSWPPPPRAPAVRPLLRRFHVWIRRPGTPPPSSRSIPRVVTGESRTGVGVYDLRIGGVGDKNATGDCYQRRVVLLWRNHGPLRG